MLGRWLLYGWGARGSLVLTTPTGGRPRDLDLPPGVRLRSGDPRLSVEERYRSKTDYLPVFDRAADELVRHGYLLPQDAAAMVAKAESLDIGLDD